MSEGCKIKRGVLVAELLVGLAYVGLMALRASGFPPSVRAANPPMTYAIGCAIVFAMTVGVFNLSHIASAKGHRAVGWVLLVFGVLMVPYMLMISFAQY